MDSLRSGVSVALPRRTTERAAYRFLARPATWHPEYRGQAGRHTRFLSPEVVVRVLRAGRPLHAFLTELQELVALRCIFVLMRRGMAAGHGGPRPTDRVRGRRGICAAGGIEKGVGAGHVCRNEMNCNRLWRLQ